MSRIPRVPPRPDDPPVLELRDLCVNLGSDRVLNNIDLTIGAGERIGIAGPNGGGKTTLLRAILGLTPTCCGTVKFFGVPLADFRERRRIGYVAQNAAHVDPSFPATALEVVLLGRVAPRGLLRRFNGEDRRLAVEALREVGLEDLQDRPIGRMSGGQRQRVLLARALASQPDILVLDEPTTGFDAAARDDFVKLLLHLNEEHNITLLLVSHDQDILAHAAGRLIVVDRGIVHDGPIGPGIPFPPDVHMHDPLVRP
jgi:zinc transport system ATP-binding protein